MLKSILAAVMIIGLSTISPPAQGPTSDNGQYTTTNRLHANGEAEAGGFIRDSNVDPSESTRNYAGLLPAHIQKPIGAAISPVETMQVPPAGEDELDQEISISYRVINELDLDANVDTVIQLFGEPLERTTDPLLGTEEFHYSELTIGVYEDLVDYIVIPASANQLQLGDVTVTVEMEELKRMLGQPDYTAEDGLVYVQDEVCLKLFYGENETELDTVQIYWLSHI